MAKKFNITGICIPEMHYMVNIENKLETILGFVKIEEYFTINRPRQFGKTTTLFEISKVLKKMPDYICLDTSFEGLGVDAYKTVEIFINEFLSQIRKQLKFQKLDLYLDYLVKSTPILSWSDLNIFITDFCSLENKKIVLLIDEVDKSMNNQLFLDFLGMLRNKYLETRKGADKTFHSVILAGVHDVKTMKLKIRPDSEQKFNSPWNIAADFDVDMSFNPKEISTMLIDYSSDKKVEIDISSISQRIHHYTSGYPFLVSRICKEIDEKILPQKSEKNWEIEDVETAVNTIVDEQNTNFDSLIKNLENTPELLEMTRKIILGSETFKFVINNPTINLGVVYGVFDKAQNKGIKIHNKIYEEVITDYLTSKAQERGEDGKISKDVVKSSYLTPSGKLNIDKVLLKFQEVIKEKYSKSDVLKSDEFLEKDLRLLFLVFLKPILNGVGFCFKEVETSEEKRLDIVILFEREKFIVELKIWRGEEYHRQGITRLKDYMRRECAQRGFMLIMDKTRYKEFTINTEEDILMVWI